jgi:hypothetical protein
MVEFSSGRRKKRVVVCAVAGAAVLAVAAVLGGWAAYGPAEIEGQTAEERMASIRQLADERAPGAADAIAKAAGEEPDPSVRATAVATLGRLHRPRDRALIEECTKAPSPAVRAAAAATLGYYGGEAVADRLGEIVRNDPSEQVRLNAVTGLGRSEHSKSIVHLLEVIETTDDPNVQHRSMREIHKKLGMRYIGAKPIGVKDWKRQSAAVAEYLKDYPKVQEAFRKAGRQLVRRPEHYYPSKDP